MGATTVVIGERINSTIAGAKRMIAERDAEALIDLACRQVQGGAAGIDINASMLMEDEQAALLWAAKLVISETDAFVSLDSPSLDLLLDVVGEFGDRALVNSITCDEETLDRALPAIAGAGSRVVVMLKSRKGIPGDPEGRCRLAATAADIASRAGVSEERIYFDPVFQPLATATGGLEIPLATFALLSERFPGHRRIGGLSNISYGLPLRRLVNRTFLSMAIHRGMDAVICDPTDTRLMDTLVAAEAIAGRDPGCRLFLSRYRERKRG